MANLIISLDDRLTQRLTEAAAKRGEEPTEFVLHALNQLVEKQDAKPDRTEKDMALEVSDLLKPFWIERDRVEATGEQSNRGQHSSDDYEEQFARIMDEIYPSPLDPGTKS